MQQLNKVTFLIALLAVAEKLQQLPEAHRTGHAAAGLLIEQGLAPKSGLGVGDDLVVAALFYGNAKSYEGLHQGTVHLMARLNEERAWESHARHVKASAKMAA